MNSFFSRNLQWKLASLALATLMWLFVINTQNPLQPKEISVPISIKGLEQLKEKGFMIQNEQELRDQRVKVVVRGPRLQVEKLKLNSNLIDVSLDLAPYITNLNEQTETTERMVAYNASVLLDNISIGDVRPKTTYIVFEKEKTVTSNINYTITGTTKSNYMALEPVINPVSVEIKGPKTKVDSIKDIVVDINVDNFSEDVISGELPIIILDETGEEVSGLELSTETAEITLPIGKTKKVPLEPQFKGTLPEGYIQSNTLLMPKEITIVGKQDIIDTIETIKLEPIALDNMIKSDTLKVDVILPKGVKSLDNVENKATVTIEVQKENSYQYLVDTSALSLDAKGVGEGYTYKLLDENLKLVLGGSAEELLKFNIESLTAQINLTGYKEGEYSVPVTLNVPENLKIINTPIVLNISIDKLAQEDDSQPKQADEPIEQKPIEGNSLIDD